MTNLLQAAGCWCGGTGVGIAVATYSPFEWSNGMYTGASLCGVCTLLCTLSAVLQLRSKDIKDIR